MLSWPAQPARLPRGVIEGVVLGEGGRPLPSARVNALAMGAGAALGTALPEAETDANGRFRMNLVAWGKYAVAEQKVSDQYPNAFGTNSSPRTRLPGW